MTLAAKAFSLKRLCLGSCPHEPYHTNPSKYFELPPNQRKKIDISEWFVGTRTKANGEGGHNIPEETIRRRYFRGIYNLTNKFTALCDYWIVINNSSRPFTFVAEGQGAKEIRVHDDMVWQQIKTQPDEKE
ncbi:MAG: hypothetical protein ABI685_11120 [Ferruginibacter sp.]